ncbi:MAG: HEAT repeat domain-containing protein [Chloroflexota bacterium]
MTEDKNHDEGVEINPTQKPTIEEVVSMLQQGEHVPAAIYYGLSDLDDVSMRVFEPTWQNLSADYKRKIVNELAEASEVNFDLNFDALSYLALDDADARVRSSAIDLLWINESLDLLSRLIDLAENDESTEVRAAAVSELGRFILLGEYGDIPEQQAVQAQDVAINLLNDTAEDIQVRRRALEAISNSSLEFIPEAIEEAYESDESLMRVSAVFAMGRSYDQRWTETVLRELQNDDPEIRYEAARAAGELEIEEAVTLLGQLAVADEREIQQVAIWSLGEIGGSQAMRLLTALAEDAEDAKDDDLHEAIEDAIGYAGMVGSDIDVDFESRDWN